MIYLNSEIFGYFKTSWGDIAQMVRACGSYPQCRWFESSYRYHTRPVGQEVKTSPFHGGIMGSIPVRVTICKLNGFVEVVNRYINLCKLLNNFKLKFQLN